MQRETEVTSEVELVERAQQGDEGAFGELFTLYQRRVYLLCLHMTRRVEEAEDLTQTTFLKLLLKLPGFRRESAFSTWLYRVAVNEVLMHLRRTRHILTVPLHEVSTRDRECEPDGWGREDPHLKSIVDRVDLRRAIAQLPSTYRTVFTLHDVQGYEHNEIALLTEASVGNSKSRLHRARQSLRQALRAA